MDIPINYTAAVVGRTLLVAVALGLAQPALGADSDKGSMSVQDIAAKINRILEDDRSDLRLIRKRSRPRADDASYGNFTVRQDKTVTFTLDELEVDSDARRAHYETNLCKASKIEIVVPRHGDAWARKVIVWAPVRGVYMPDKMNSRRAIWRKVNIHLHGDQSKQRAETLVESLRMLQSHCR